MGKPFGKLFEEMTEEEKKELKEEIYKMEGLSKDDKELLFKLNDLWVELARH